MNPAGHTWNRVWQWPMSGVYFMHCTQLDLGHFLSKASAWNSRRSSVTVRHDYVRDRQESFSAGFQNSVTAMLLTFIVNILVIIWKCPIKCLSSWQHHSPHDVTCTFIIVIHSDHKLFWLKDHSLFTAFCSGHLKIYSNFIFKHFELHFRYLIARNFVGPKWRIFENWRNFARRIMSPDKFSLNKITMICLKDLFPS